MVMIISRVKKLRKNEQMLMENKDKTIIELALMLMYLTSWEEAPTCGLHRKPMSCSPEDMVRRCWKGYDHGVLGELEEQGLIADSRSRTPMYITEDGEKQALKLLKDYGIVSDIGEELGNGNI